VKKRFKGKTLKYMRKIVLVNKFNVLIVRNTFSKQMHRPIRRNVQKH